MAPQEDEHVARRRAAVADARAALDAPVVMSTPIGLDEVIDALSPWIVELFEGLDDLGDARADASVVTTQVDALMALRGRVSANGRRRPMLALWDPLAALLSELAKLAAAEIGAATAADPDDAKAFEVIGQAHLDEAARQIGLVNARVDWWGVERSIKLPEPLIAAASAAYDATGAQNIIDLDSRGMRLYERITGRPNGPSGVGLGLLIDLGLADRAFDEARLYGAAAQVYARLDTHRAGFVQLLDDAGWRADLLHARRVFYEAQLTAETLLRELAGNRRLEAGAVLRLGAQMTERVSGALLGLVVAVDPVTSFKRTTPYDKAHEAARRLGLGATLLGFDDRIRNADAHSDYDVGPDYVLLGRNRSNPEKLTDDDLVDTVLASLESCAAIAAAIDCVIAEEGHPAGQDRLDDLPLEDLLAIVIAASGVHPERIDLGFDRLEVSGTAHGNLGINALSVIATLLPFVPSRIHRLVFRLRLRRGTVLASVALEPLRQFQAGEGLAKDVAFVEFLGRARLNGRAVFSRRHVRFLIAYYVHGHLEVPLDDLEKVGSVLGNAARRLDDPELAAAVSAFVAMRRAQLGGPPAPRAVRRDFDRLASYLATPPGPWNDGSGGNLVPA